MTNGWQTKLLGDLFDITSSKRVFEADWKTEGVPFYRAREIVKLARHGFVANELFISEEMFNRYSTKYGIPTPGDIMVTGVGTLGICYVVKDGDRFYFKDGNIIWLKKKSDTDSRFVEYAFQSDFLRSQIDDSVGATVGTFTIIKAKNTRIPLPPLSEQKRIVGILDEAFEGLATAKANAEKNLQNARAIFESHLQSVFTRRGNGWMEKKLDEVCTFVNGRAYKREEMLSAGKYPLLRVGNFFTNRDWYYSDLELEADKYCDTGDLLYAWSASFGPRIWDGGKVIYHYHIWKVLPNTAVVEKRFLLHLLEWDVDQIKQAHGTGTTMMHVSKGSMESRVVPIPPLKEQAGIISVLDELTTETERLASLYEQKLAALEALKRSLLHHAFTGQL